MLFIDNVSSNEEWKQIDNTTYFISTKGRILSKGDKYNRYKHNNDIILRKSIKDNGYEIVNINGKNCYVHRLVASAFIPNVNNFPEVNHINKIKHDNRVENLEWCDGKYNVSYSISKKIKQIDINTKKVIAVFNSALQAGKSVNCGNNPILQCCNRIKYRTYKDYIWRFYDDNDYDHINCIIKKEQNAYVKRSAIRKYTLNFQRR